MRRLIKWAIRLYPLSWRMRYGAEFDTLVDELDLRWRDIASVVQGGLVMRLKNPEPWLRRRAITIGLAVSLLVGALAVAAADDITTGSEPSFVAEWFMLVSAGIWFAATGMWVSRRKSLACANIGFHWPVVLIVLAGLMAALAIAAIVEITAG